MTIILALALVLAVSLLFTVVCIQRAPLVSEFYTDDQDFPQTETVASSTESHAAVSMTSSPF